MNKVGMFSWFSYPMAIQKRFELIKEAGFDATSLWWAESDRNSQPDMARGIGLEIDNIHAPFHNMSNNLWLDGVDGEDYLNLLISCVNDCNMHDIETVVIHATGFRTVPAISQVGIDRIKKLVDFAEKKEVNLAFENLSTLDHLDYILTNIDSERVGFCYDSGHEHCGHLDANCLKLYGDKLFAIHIDDNFGDADTHLLPYDGTANWENIKQDIKNSRKIKYYTLEVDFNPNDVHSDIYKKLSALEFLQLAYTKVQKVIN